MCSVSPNPQADKMPHAAISVNLLLADQAFQSAMPFKAILTGV